MNDNITIEVKQNTVEENDTRLRILYLYQILLSQSDEDHPLTTKQIMEQMESLHGIRMHRTTVPNDIALLKAAGFEIMAERKQAWNYYLSDRTFSIPELKLLIDTVQASKFITEKKSKNLIDKLISLTSETNADKLIRSVHVNGKVKSENEKGYYIIDAINDAMNTGKKISFKYFDYSGSKRQVLKNDGKPYTVSPYDLICDGDFYYMTGFCDDRDEVRVFRVDRIVSQPTVLVEELVPAPKDYDVQHYTQEVFRMYASDETVTVKLLCENSVMKAIVDHFGKNAKTRVVDKEHFRAEVKVCVGPTFYRWVFGWRGKIKILGPDNIKEDYKSMLQEAIEAMS